ncbi:Aliphatic amidase expression-regulating protein [Gimesia panareensis]|uniref:Aliphatic amidase expression-regulating protein n=2 Tax=Gimesia panareensis TaxID=2527978 RepID=A0A518FHF9_9PLAN|nr:Aliphatic amidase expression-regulating protein [Gimesia panareensis]
MSNSDPGVRQYVAKKLGEAATKQDAVVKTLGKACQDDDLLVAQTSIESLGKLGYQSREALNDLVYALDSPRVGIRLRAGNVVSDLAQMLRDKRETELLPEFRKALGKMTKGGFPENNALAVSTVINQLEEMEHTNHLGWFYENVFNKVWFWVVFMYGIVFLFIKYIGVRLFPLWILKANTELKQYTDINLFGGVTVPLRLFFLIGFVQFNPHILDAWVKKYINQVSENFKKINTVSRRDVYVPVPFSLDGVKKDGANSEHFALICKKTPWCIQIKGAGGTGKTALACQMALWAMHENGELIPDRPIIPVLIEPTLGTETISNIQSLMMTIEGQLAALVGEKEKLPEEFVEQLLRQGRVLVIIDDVVALAGENWNLPRDPDFPVAALITTSRTEQRLGNIPLHIAEPLSVNGNQLSSFLDTYLTQKNQREGFDDTEFFDAITRLTSIIPEVHDQKKTTMTVLFARMYADQLISAKEQGSNADLPRDIPNLMVNYLLELNRHFRELGFDDSLVFRIAKLIAWECLKEQYSPSIANKNFLLEILPPENGQGILSHLELNLGIIQTTVDFEGVRFTIDPLAEYLAGLHLVADFGKDSSKWDALISKLENRSKSSDEINGFLVALRDCCLARGAEEVLNTVPGKLARLGGIASILKDVVKVGVLHSLTGNMQISERPLVDAIEVAVDEINRQGGVLGRKIVIASEDGKSNDLVFAEKAKKLIDEDKVCSIFGCWTSASRQSVLPIIQDRNHLLWYPVQYEGMECSPHVIYSGAAPNQQILPAIEWCLSEKGKRIFLVGSDYVFPQKANEIIKAYLKNKDLEPVGEEYRCLAERDFSSVISKILDAKPDIVFNTINGEGNMAFFRELYEAGIKPDDIPVMSVSLAEVEVRAIGTTLTKGHYCAWNYFQSIDTPANTRFVEAFKHAKGMDRVTDDPIEASYFQVHLFAKAIAAAKSDDPIAIRGAVLGMRIAAPGGEVMIDKNTQHTHKMARIGKIREDGQFDIVWDSGKPIKPEPYPTILYPEGPPLD